VNICIIPARGGSKRIPRKNVAMFHGRPMIAWSIAAAHQSGLFSSIVVSTDDDEIAQIAVAEGAVVPFMRPADLADDFVPTVPVIAHAVSALNLDYGTPVCCIYATAPLIQPEDLRRSLAQLVELKPNYVFSVTQFPYPIQRALRRDQAGLVKMMRPEHANSRSQDLEEAWHDAGQFYFALAGTWLANTPVFEPPSLGIALPRHRVQDIDTPEDWARAEMLFSSLIQESRGRR
jgi:pseudaminic acid cytidylyltransferase